MAGSVDARGNTAWMVLWRFQSERACAFLPVPLRFPISGRQSGKGRGPDVLGANGPHQMSGGQQLLFLTDADMSWLVPIWVVELLIKAN